jgi:hypothetical protein
MGENSEKSVEGFRKNMQPPKQKKETVHGS